MAKNKFNKKTIEDVKISKEKSPFKMWFKCSYSWWKITDDQRIRASIPTIKYLATHGAKVVICSHLGKPEKHQDIEPVCKALSKALKMPINLLEAIELLMIQ